MIQLRTLTRLDLPSMARIHIEAFPGRALSQLGLEAIERYYAWQLGDAHQAVSRGATSDGSLVGFYVGGSFAGSLSGFLRKHRRYLAGLVLRRPSLLTSPLVRDRLRLAASILTRPRPRTPPTPTSDPRRAESFGILAIAVAPGAQGRGVGRLLMDDAEQQARSRGQHQMHLSVDKANAGAIEFYRKLGWDRVEPWAGKMTRKLA